MGPVVDSAACGCAADARNPLGLRYVDAAWPGCSAGVTGAAAVAGVLSWRATASSEIGSGGGPSAIAWRRSERGLSTA